MTSTDAADNLNRIWLAARRRGPASRVGPADHDALRRSATSRHPARDDPGLMHDKLSDPAVGQWVADLGDTTDPICKAAVRNIGRDHDRAVKVPTRLVAEIAAASNAGFGDWMKAREANDFGPFQAALERLVELRREEISHLGAAENPYDHLLDQYDPGSTTAQLQPMFARLRRELAGFLDDVKGAAGPAAVQGPGRRRAKRFSDEVIDAMGFRLNDGRLDASEHPFTVGMGTGDVRLTTHRG